MAIGKELLAVRDLLSSWFKTTVFPKVKEVNYAREILFAIGVVSGLSAGMVSYRYYVSYREQAAQETLSQYMQEYFQASAQKMSADWSGIAFNFERGYAQYSNSYLAPYFLAFQADALIQQDQKGQALIVMNTMLEGLGTDSPLFNVYATKRALVQIDSDELSEQQAGVESLTKLADDVSNSNQDLSLFYLGSYYWAQDNVEQAKQAWQKLVSLQDKDALTKSPWSLLAQEKLDQVS